MRVMRMRIKNIYTHFVHFQWVEGIVEVIKKLLSVIVI